MTSCGKTTLFLTFPSSSEWLWIDVSLSSELIDMSFLLTDRLKQCIDIVHHFGLQTMM